MYVFKKANSHFKFEILENIGFKIITPPVIQENTFKKAINTANIAVAGCLHNTGKVFKFK